MNPELTERAFAKTSAYLVGREKVREFARAVFCTDPVSLSVEAARAAGHADLVAPPTFAIVLQQLTLDQIFESGDAGFVVEDVVHGEQRFVPVRPIVAGDELTAQLRVTGIKSLGGNAMLTAETEIHDAAGALVATAVATLVVRAEA